MKPPITELHRLDRYLVPILSIIAVLIVVYAGAHYLIDSYMLGNNPYDLLQWRTAITPDNALTVLSLAGMFTVLAVKLRKINGGIVIAACLFYTVYLLGNAMFELVTIGFLDLPQLSQLDVVMMVTFAVILYFRGRNGFLKFFGKFYIFLLLMVIPYIVWRVAHIPYAFYYFNNVIHKTVYFNSDIAHAWSVGVWVYVLVLAVIMFSRGIRDKR